MRGFFCLVLLLLFCTGGYAQVAKRLSREAIDSLKNPVLAAEDERTLFFVSQQIDMGVIYESDAPIEVAFKFVNSGSKKERITKVTTNCGCTGAVYCDKEIMPGDSSEVVVTFNPRRRAGTVDTNAFVYTASSGTTPVARLTLLGNVVDKDEWSHLPCTMGCLKLKRKSVTFEPVEPGSVPQQRIPCANIGTRSVTLSSRLLPPYVRLFTEPSEIAPGEEADIVISVVGDELPAVMPHSFNIVVEGVEGRVSDRTIKVIIEK